MFEYVYITFDKLILDMYQSNYLNMEKPFVAMEEVQSQGAVEKKLSVEWTHQTPTVTVTRPVQIVKSPAKASRSVLLGYGVLVVILSVVAVLTILTYAQVKVRGEPGTIILPHKISKRNTGSSCIVSCSGLSNGDYQSCTSCQVYASCWNEVLTDNRPCLSGLVWDDILGRCEYQSRTCSNDGTPSSTLSTPIPTTTTQEPGDGVCITSCAGKNDGAYQSCSGCDVFAICGDGVLYDDIPCPASLVWEDTTRRCEYTSTTCNTTTAPP